VQDCREAPKSTRESRWLPFLRDAAGEVPSRRSLRAELLPFDASERTFDEVIEKPAI